LQGLGTAEVGNNVGRNETDASVSSAELTSARDAACALEHRFNGLRERLDNLVKQVDTMYDQLSENELIFERTISKIADEMDAQSRAQATQGDTYASVLKSNFCSNKDHKE
jgi:hypothetical protein